MEPNGEMQEQEKDDICTTHLHHVKDRAFNLCSVAQLKAYTNQYILQDVKGEL